MAGEDVWESRCRGFQKLSERPDPQELRLPPRSETYVVSIRLDLNYDGGGLTVYITKYILNNKDNVIFWRG